MLNFFQNTWPPTVSRGCVFVCAVFFGSSAISEPEHSERKVILHQPSEEFLSLFQVLKTANSLITSGDKWFPSSEATLRVYFIGASADLNMLPHPLANLISKQNMSGTAYTRLTAEVGLETPVEIFIIDQRETTKSRLFWDCETIRDIANFYGDAISTESQHVQNVCGNQ